VIDATPVLSHIKVWAKLTSGLRFQLTAESPASGGEITLSGIAKVAGTVVGLEMFDVSDNLLAAIDVTNRPPVALGDQLRVVVTTNEFSNALGTKLSDVLEDDTPKFHFEGF